ncbi:MAG: DNA repair protein RecN [candidate division WS1 bacterium]|jgi:DNA repair protein RecN (Recombination protein N)|nr:DNA repair protein RecN [candidate division WS1 bacterium]
MLRELAVENFALIERLRLELGSGFTVLTGETGAGKSIIIDALGALLGEHVTGEAIRAGAGRARVEGVFDLSGHPQVRAALTAAALEDEDGVLLLARQITPERSQYYLNGRSATRTLVRQFGELLVDIHGQHEHQTLIHEASHLDFLDAFGQSGLGPKRAAYEEAWAHFHSLQQELADLRVAERDRGQRLDLLTFQAQEIAEARLDPAADGGLLAEHARLANAERLQEAVAEALAALEGEFGEQPGAAEALASANLALQAVLRFDADLEPLLGELQAAETVVREAARSLQGYAQALEFEPRKLAQVEERLALLDRLLRKYATGPEVSPEQIQEILAFGQQAAEELAELEGLDLRLQEMEKALESAREQAGQAAEALSAARQKAARKLEQALVAEIRRLGMEQGAFAVEFQRRPDPEGLPDASGQRQAADARGFDQVRFLLSANAGEPLRPLSAVASGGELSRLMLALKSLCAAGTVPTLVFDEIDVGIGGVTAHAVGAKLKRLAQTAQVLCVTHLPQIASTADHQVLVSKALQGEAGAEQRTIISARSLAEGERAPELARMMGAAQDQEQALRHAEEMLRQAAEDAS